MDPLTQGLIGAALPQAATRERRLLLRAGGFGFVAGLLADLDVLIRSAADPLLFLEYHRQFTHALVFVPVGGLLCAALFRLLLFRKRRDVPFGSIWACCTLGYGTHGLLDAATSYGTMLWWPFSSARVALNIVSIVDPLVTLPVLALVVLAARRKRRRFAVAALLWAGLYLGAGMWQREAALAMGEALAASRGHAPLRLDAKPGFANILVWKIVYEADGRFHVDAVRPTLAPRVFAGASVARLDVARDFPGLDPGTQQRRDIDRFAVFSDGFVARDPQRPDRIVDVRYSMVPNEIDGLWSIGVSDTAGPDAHVTFHTHRRDPQASLRRLWSMLTASAPE
jgi:inner membrane protein